LKFDHPKQVNRIELLFIDGQHQTTAQFGFAKIAGGVRRHRALKRSDGHWHFTKSVRSDGHLPSRIEPSVHALRHPNKKLHPRRFMT
jgi:hypothetical protein